MTRRRLILGWFVFAAWLLAAGVPRVAALPPGWRPMGTMEGETQGDERSRCQREGSCDEPTERDQWAGAHLPGNELTVRLRFNVFGDGQNFAASPEQISRQVHMLNQHFTHSNIRFVADPPHFINDTRFYDFCGAQQQHPACRCNVVCRSESCDSEERDMKVQYADNPGQKLNVYVLQLYPNQPYVGVGYFPWCSEATSAMGGVVIDGPRIGGTDDCWDEDEHEGKWGDCSVLSHEIGHNLGLWHTHRGVSENCRRYQPGSCSACCDTFVCSSEGCLNPMCDKVGDFCCDTPPTRANTNCEDATSTDTCVDPPRLIEATDYQNVMGYAPD